MFLFVFYVSVALVALSLAYWYYLQYKFRALKDIPGPKPIPFLGNVMPGSLKGILDFMVKLHETYGENVKLWTGPKLRVLITNPDDVEKILSSQIHLTKSSTFDLLKVWLGEGVLVQGGSVWKKTRRMLTPSFHFKILENFMTTFNQSSTNLVKKLDEVAGKPSVDIYKLVTLHTLDVICETSMGFKLNALDESSENEYVKWNSKMLKLLSERVFSVWKMNEFLFTTFASSRDVYRKAIEVTQNLSRTVIQNRLKKLEEEGGKINLPEDEIGIKSKVALIDTLVNPANNLTPEQIRSEIDTFMFAGHDTTASSISFTLYEIARHPDIQQKLYEEIVSVIGLDDVEMTTSQLHDLKYMEMVIKESLRVHSPIIMVERCLTEPFEIGNITYPTGTILTPFLYAMHMDKNLYPDPYKFDPERFSPDNCAKRHKFAFVPFSAGPRNCIGQRYAIFEMKTTILKILQNFELSPVPGHQLKHAFTGILKSENGILLRLKRREY
ncbi:cytochrome P450 4d2-like [Aethina tumida]|uniref:cytochrome P450 4d2-like n=1 Tax=Aethina tumida TaxID=116153 RepID=UPI0021483766|nr:cytochrome P450 4d2-like [Aethina tumida]